MERALISLMLFAQSYECIQAKLIIETFFCGLDGLWPCHAIRIKAGYRVLTYDLEHHKSMNFNSEGGFVFLVNE